MSAYGSWACRLSFFCNNFCMIRCRGPVRWQALDATFHHQTWLFWTTVVGRWSCEPRWNCAANTSPFRTPSVKWVWPDLTWPDLTWTDLMKLRLIQGTVSPKLLDIEFDKSTLYIVPTTKFVKIWLIWLRLNGFRFQTQNFCTAKLLLPNCKSVLWRWSSHW